MADGDDDYGEELVVTFGMLRSDLVEMLSAIAMSSSGLEDILKTNKHLTPSDVRLISAAIENYASMVSVFSLSGEITQKEIDIGVRKMYARLDLVEHMQVMQEALRESIMGDSKTSLQRRREAANNDDPNPYLAEVYGDEYI